MLKRDTPGNDPLVLALDGGTGSCRAILFDLKGREVAVGQREWHHPTTPEAPGGMDFDTATNGVLFDEVCREVVADIDGAAERIKAISTTSMREGMVLYDDDGAVLWACPNVDGRAREQAEELAQSGMAARIFETAGDWVSLTSSSRFLWIRQNQPELFDRTKVFGLISDWIATRLTGEYTTEPSAGSSSALFDLKKRSWSTELISDLGLDPAICPRVVESGEICGEVTAEAAARTGLEAGTPVYAGGGDTQLALVGLAQKPGDATLVAGSFWQMTAITNQPVIDPKRRARTLCHARPGQWMIEGIGFFTGFSLRWFRDAFCELEDREASETGRSVFEIMEEKAGQVPPGCNGLHAVFSSVMQSDSWSHPPPSFVGFDVNNAGGSNRVACIRALMESGAFVSDLHRAIVSECTGRDYQRIMMTGGSAQGQVWPQIIADAFNAPVDISTVKETTALGAAILAAQGAGLIADATEMASGIERTHEPDPDAHSVLREKHAEWQSLDAEMVSLALRGLAEPMWRAPGGLPRS
ncbi:FGGY family carbohydrate kinase [Hoeflea prorocentri]|uniref:FGGY family carbohydrate kinase n=1 Tax=Hoeflea prorocentri TaxID=1922333 RepID=A0A9X3UJ15_9HYPH|nr:FGGY family carbohydrate kinase [Hoeflea prorocentri]MCY6381564.1 FGGY family carbohydrate kinase [Hoeflea prorocentri]MDA5399364.1 FGGY family carbohydrate kinase [Hoeflea prorocentri]